MIFRLAAILLFALLVLPVPSSAKSLAPSEDEGEGGPPPRSSGEGRDSGGGFIFGGWLVGAGVIGLGLGVSKSLPRGEKNRPPIFAY